MKTAEREWARRLRREEGRSVKEITKLVGVSRSSVSLWVRDIELTEAQKQALRDRNPAFNAWLNGSAARSAHFRDLRRGYQERGRELARAGDEFHAAGCMLYWAEGDKNGRRVALSNADPEVLRFFLSFLRKYFEVENERVRLRCNLFADHLARQREVEQFWLDLLDLPRQCLWKSALNVYSKYSERKRQKMLPYGTTNLTVGDVSILQSIYGSIQEYAGFERPEWLG
jgi:AcrR family transcriptional regulator